MRAYTRKNDETKKFELVIDGNVFRKTAGGEVYLLPGLEDYRNFKDLNVSTIHLMNGTEYKIGGDVDESIVKDENSNKLEKKVFDVNQRYDFMEKLVNMICNQKIESAIITGSGGLGKTYTVLNCMTDNDFEEEDGDYIIIKGYSTAKGLYRTLYENRNKIIIFDDCDSILKDQVARNILKGALDSYDKRIITWNAEMSKNDDLPKSFRFSGNVIFISNMVLSKFDQALISRSMVIDLTMSKEDILDRMEYVLEDLMPTVDLKIKYQALEFLKENVDYVGDLNFRTLMKVIKIVDNFKNDWQDLALYTISN